MEKKRNNGDGVIMLQSEQFRKCCTCRLINTCAHFERAFCILSACDSARVLKMLFCPGNGKRNHAILLPAKASLSLGASLQNNILMPLLTSHSPHTASQANQRGGKPPQKNRASFKSTPASSSPAPHPTAPSPSSCATSPAPTQRPSSSTAPQAKTAPASSSLSSCRCAVCLMRRSRTSTA